MGEGILIEAGFQYRFDHIDDGRLGRPVPDGGYKQGIRSAVRPGREVCEQRQRAVGPSAKVQAELLQLPARVSSPELQGDAIHPRHGIPRFDPSKGPIEVFNAGELGHQLPQWAQNRHSGMRS